jgi:hypothetical protein
LAGPDIDAIELADLYRRGQSPIAAIALASLGFRVRVPTWILGQ